MLKMIIKRKFVKDFVDVWTKIMNADRPNLKKLINMTELTSGIFNAAKDIYNNNKGSILRTIVYTIGHLL